MTISLIMLIFITALLFGAAGTPIVRQIAIKAGFIAVPKADRAHTEPTALMGGVAIYGAAAVALTLITVGATLLLGNRFRLSEVGAITVGASLMAGVGYLDDRYTLSPRWKLLGEVVPALVVFGAGVRIQLPILPIGSWNIALNFALTVLWILFITNALNYMDNADGVAIMTTAAAAAIFMLIALLNDQQLVSILAAAVLGASLGFARYNLPLPKSTIFMGDSGSLFLGFLLAVLGIKIRVPGNSNLITWMVPVLVLGFPIFDTVMVYISRKRRGISFFQGGVDHTTHRLARFGMSGLAVAFFAALVTGALGLTAIFITQATAAEALVVGVTLLAVAGYALWWLEFRPSFFHRTGREPEIGD